MTEPVDALHEAARELFGEVVLPTETEDNPVAALTLGKRAGGFVLDQPCELGYHCPVCKYDLIDAEGEFDERLTWSEYNNMIWCYVCKKDYPSPFCYSFTEDMDKAIRTFLDCMADIAHRARVENTTHGTCGQCHLCQGSRITTAKE